MYTYIHIYTFMYTYIYLHIVMYTFWYICVYIYVYTYIFIHICMHVHIYMHVYTYIYIYICTIFLVYICMCIYISINLCMYNIWIFWTYQYIHLYVYQLYSCKRISLQFLEIAVVDILVAVCRWMGIVRSGLKLRGVQQNPIIHTISSALSIQFPAHNQRRLDKGIAVNVRDRRHKACAREI